MSKLQIITGGTSGMGLATAKAVSKYGPVLIGGRNEARLGEAYPAYCASKRFVMYYTMANALRFGKKNNRIFSIAPGSFDTPMLATQAAFMGSIIKGTAFQRVGSPEEMAQLIATLLDPKVQYLTGCDIIMDGGKFAMATVKQLK